MGWRSSDDERTAMGCSGSEQLRSPLRDAAEQKGSLLAPQDVPSPYRAPYLVLAWYCGPLHTDLQDRITRELRLERDALTRTNIKLASAYAAGWLVAGLGMDWLSGGADVEWARRALDLSASGAIAYAGAIAAVSGVRAVHNRRTRNPSFAPLGSAAAITLGYEAVRSVGDAVMDGYLLWRTRGRAEKFPLLRERARVGVQHGRSFVGALLPDT